MLLLVGFAIVQAVQLRNIRRERDRADRITQFMTGMFKMSKPSEARGNTITAREILDKGEKEIDVGLKNEPELQAKMMYTMAETYEGLGLESRAQPLLERALQIQRRVLGTEHPDTLRSMGTLATVLAYEGHYPEAEKIQRETLEVRRRVLGPEHPDTLASMSLLGATLDYDGHTAEGEELQRETLAIRRRVLGPEHQDTLASMSFLAYAVMTEGRYVAPGNLIGAHRDFLGRKEACHIGLQCDSELPSQLHSRTKLLARKLWFHTANLLDLRAFFAKHPAGRIERGHLLLFKYRAGPHRHVRFMYGRVQPRQPSRL